MSTFTASRLSEDNGLFPCKIIVGGNKITVRIPGLFNNRDKDIYFDKISEVSVETPLIGYSTIIFYTTGIGVVSAHGFTKSEVKEIKRLIEDGGTEQKAESEPYKSIFFDEEQSTDHTDESLTVEEPIKEVTPKYINATKDEDSGHVSNSEAISSASNTQKVSPEILKRLEQLEKKERNREKEAELKREIEYWALWLPFFDNEISEAKSDPFLLYFLLRYHNKRKSTESWIEVITGFLTSEEYAEIIDDDMSKHILNLIEGYYLLKDKTNIDIEEFNAVEFKSAFRHVVTVIKRYIKEIEEVKKGQAETERTRINFIMLKKDSLRYLSISIYETLYESWPEELQNSEFYNYLENLTCS